MLRKEIESESESESQSEVESESEGERERASERASERERFDYLPFPPCKGGLRVNGFVALHHSFPTTSRGISIGLQGSRAWFGAGSKFMDISAAQKDLVFKRCDVCLIHKIDFPLTILTENNCDNVKTSRLVSPTFLLHRVYTGLSFI